MWASKIHILAIHWLINSVNDLIRLEKNQPSPHDYTAISLLSLKTSTGFQSQWLDCKRKNRPILATCCNTVLKMRKIDLISLELSLPTGQVGNEPAGYYKEAEWLQHMREWCMGSWSECEYPSSSLSSKSTSANQLTTRWCGRTARTCKWPWLNCAVQIRDITASKTVQSQGQWMSSPSHTHMPVLHLRVTHI